MRSMRRAPGRGRVPKALEWSLAASVLIVAGLAWAGETIGPLADRQIVSRQRPRPPQTPGRRLWFSRRECVAAIRKRQVIRVEIPSPEGVITADAAGGPGWPRSRGSACSVIVKETRMRKLAVVIVLIGLASRFTRRNEGVAPGSLE